MWVIAGRIKHKMIDLYGRIDEYFSVFERVELHLNTFYIETIFPKNCLVFTKYFQLK